MVSMLMGSFDDAREHFERAFTAANELSEPQKGASLILGQTLIGAFYEANFYPAFRAFPLWALAYSDQALESSRQTLAAAEKQSRPALLANGEGSTAIVHMFLREPACGPTARRGGDRDSERSTAFHSSWHSQQ
jgi:hypothetical protein